MSSVSVTDVLAPYDKLISTFNVNQQSEWAVWSGHLPQRVTAIINEHIISGQKVNLWQNLSYFFMILSAAIPIIVALLIETMNLPHLAHLVDALFPAITTVVQKKLSEWSQRRYALGSVYSPYQMLLASIITDIFANRYSNKSQIHQTKFQDLEETLLNANIIL